MDNERARIMKMLKERTIDADEADTLLSALEPSPNKKRYWWSPVSEIRSELLWVGVLFSFVIQVLIGTLFPLRFDGAFDLHIVTSSDLKTTVEDLFIIFVSLLLAFGVFGKIANRQTRIVDIASMLMFCRLPCLLTAPLLGMAAIHGSEILILAMVIPVVGGLTLSCVWLFSAFRDAADLRGGRAFAFYFGALVVAEILSKVLIGVMR